MIKAIVIEGAEQVFHLVRERSELCLYRVEIRTIKVTPTEDSGIHHKRMDDR